MGFIKSVKSGIVWTFLQQFSVQSINFGVQMILARLLLPSDFGLIAMINIFIAVGQTLSDSGMTSSLIRNKENSEKDYGTVFITNFFVSLLLYLIIFFTAPFIAQFYDQKILTSILRVYALVYVISSFSVVQIARFTKELKFKDQFKYQLPSVICGACAGIIMAFLDYGVWSLVGLNIVQALTFSLFLLIFYSWKPKLVFEKDTFKYHFNFGYKLTLSGLLDTIYLNLYKVIIGKKFSITSVGYFSQADSLRLFPINQLSSVLNKVTFPLFASIGNDDEKLKRAYRSSVRLVLSVSAALMLILILVAKPLILLVFGAKWLPSVPYFQILCVASIFLPFSRYNLTILKVKGRSDLFLRVEVIKKVIGFITLFLCIPFGIYAIVWGLCITNVSFAYINGYFSGRLINHSLLSQILETLKIILGAILAFIVTYLLGDYFNIASFGSFLSIVTTTFIFLCLYAPIVFVFNKELIKDLSLILKRK